MLNAAQVKACNSYSKLSLPETPLLLLEFHGSEVEVAEQSKNFRDIAAECGGGDFTWTTKQEDRTRLWQARHDAYWSVKALRPGDSIGVVATATASGAIRNDDQPAPTLALGWWA